MKFKVTLVYNLRSTTSFVIDNHRSGVLHFCVKIYNGNLIRVDSSLFFFNCLMTYVYGSVLVRTITVKKIDFYKN